MGLDFSYIILFLTTLFCLFGTGRQVLGGKTNSYVIIIPVFSVFYVLPVFLDIFTGWYFEDATYYSTVYVAMSDSKTSLIYNYYSALVLLVFYRESYFINKVSNNNELNFSVTILWGFINRWKFFLWLTLFAPAFFALMSGDLAFYSSYAERARAEASSLQVLANKTVGLATPIAALMVSYYIGKLKTKKSAIALIALLVVLLVNMLNVYIHGKRSIAAILLVLTILSLFYTKVISRRTLVFITLASLYLFYLFLTLYGKNISDAQTLLQVYQGLRIDFSRDYSTKFVIFHELLNNTNVLPYYGASYLYLLLFFIPRAIWLTKPWPYAVYFTNSAFGNFGEANLYGWGLTTSFVAEAVSNLEWLGLLFFPFFYIYMIRKIEKTNAVGLKLLGYLIFTLLLLIEPIAIMPLIIALLVMLLLKKFKFTVSRK